MKAILLGVILTQLGLALGQMDTCQSTQRFTCIFGTDGITEANCATKQNCQWCPSQRLKRRCQTSDRACIVTDNMEEPTFTTKATCEAEGFAWCGGPTPVCVHNEPARELCFKINDIEACPTSHDNDEVGCNTDPDGCFYCTEAVTERINKCWKLPASALCTNPEICCDQAACMRDFTQATCEAKGCNYCNDQGVEYCSFGPPPPEPPTVQPPPACPTTALVEDCYMGLPDRTPNEMECENLGCIWCSENETYVCKREMFPAMCDAGVQVQCDEPGLIMTQQECKSWGCEWCGSSSSNLECQKSTSCTNCDCPDPQPCQGSTPQACGLNGCLWCDDGTTVGNYSCINMNSGGVTPDKANNWTECSRTCDKGTQWRFSECNHSNPYSCPREYRTCSYGPCPCRTSCHYGVRFRYNDSDTCCQSHTYECGRNILNENRPPPAQNGGRKKRVVGGGPTGSVDKWPWLVVIYFNISGAAATKCTGTLIADKWVITAAGCVSGKDPTDSEVHLDVYDRDETPGVTRGIVQFHTEPSDMNVALVELDAVVTPYSNCVHPLCMPSGEEVAQDRKCVVAGWGATNASDPAGCTLIPHDATVCVMDFALCQQTWSGMVNMDEHLCAGIPEGGPDACIGDLGAPLMCQRCENCAWFLAGVATGYVSCGAAQASSVYYAVEGDVETWVHMQFTPLEGRPYPSCSPDDHSFEP